jgi:scyllo-inositol 2-dehydrogenase (NADP+)
MKNIAIIGMGRMGITHFAILNNHPDVVIKAVADTSSLVISLLKKYFGKINTYTDYNDLLEKEKLDAVLICTPPNLHFRVTKRASDSGLHVFCEKPFTISKKEANELAALFRDKNLVNQVGYVNRFNDIFKTVRSQISAGMIGKIISFKSEMYSCTITKPTSGATWRDTREGGGGAVFEMASHAIDLVNYLIGKPDKVIGSSLIKIYSKNVDDAVSSTFLYKNGISGTLNVNWSDLSFRKPTNKIEIFGSGGKILADQHSYKVFLKNKHPELNMVEGWNTRYITDVFQPVPFYLRGNEFTAQLFHFIDCLNGAAEENICTFLDAAGTHDIIDDILNDSERNILF